MSYQANENKALEVVVDGVDYLRIPIKTRVILKEDKINEVVKEYATAYLEPGDHLFVTEKIIAIMQGRAHHLDDIHPRPLAKFLSKYVTKRPGSNLSLPESMELILQECGTFRILFAAGVSAVGKVFGRSGDFYNIAGEAARSIDAPVEATIAPFNKYVVLAPLNPEFVAQQLRDQFEMDVAVSVVDINDIGGNILGTSSNAHISDETLVRILKDNPLGQEGQSTPMGIIRQGKPSEF